MQVVVVDLEQRPHPKLATSRHHERFTTVQNAITQHKSAQGHQRCELVNMDQARVQHSLFPTMRSKIVLRSRESIWIAAKNVAVSTRCGDGDLTILVGTGAR